MTPAFLAEWNRLWPPGSRMLWTAGEPREVTTRFPAHAGGVCIALAPGDSTGPVVPLADLIPIPNQEVTPIV
jgi:hypothetical protein